MVEFRIEKTWKVATFLVVLIAQFCGFLWWATSVYLELRDARIAQQRQVQVVTQAVDKLTVSLDGLASALADHETRLRVHEHQIKALERQGR